MVVGSNPTGGAYQFDFDFGYAFGMFTKEELEEALRAIDSTINKCVKVQPKLQQGTSQHTLLIRRIKALQIASSLIRQAMENHNA
jgi:hypothetical protein